MVLIECGPHLLAKKAGRTVIDTKRTLLKDDVPFRQHDLFGQDKAGHAVGFQLHDQGQSVLGDASKIGREVPGCKCIVLAAIARNDLAVFSIRHRLGPLEEQMFEEVREA